MLKKYGIDKKENVAMLELIADTYEEAKSADARKFAVTEGAQEGCSGWGVEQYGTPFAVLASDPSKIPTVEQIRGDGDNPPLQPEDFKFRVTFKLVQGL